MARLYEFYCDETDGCALPSDEYGGLTYPCYYAEEYESGND